ncbi:hypothetical protein W911_04740 [Hyphomicrobium nitrativorans NL23]|uniref:Uncharacterized protein n=1 Tax=Hyphomicrobium nitrativorans NL23 TaxID=1029756 RepID=V5SGH3_9HYPH|nr:hypothetical protein [Hyphomicrobium nitrativorans]AHB49966.1 hypothetical protein W911_04740 [Hyphomicrobium nitrativorans NL23]
MESFRPHLKDRLRRAFREGSEQELMRRARTPDQITRIREIGERSATRINRAQHLFRELYEARIGRETKRLMNERAALKRELKLSGIRSDAFDGVSLRHAAERAARQRQEQLVARIRQASDQQKRAVVGLPDRRNGNVREPLRAVFERTRQRS